ncbi:MAG: hypothetical protein ACRC8S_09835 [Fimbriiglobus sp.]
MNLYFLVEGRNTEREVYPAWLKVLLPDHSQVEIAREVAGNHWYLISGEGNPNLFDRPLANAIEELNDTHFDYFIICLDAEDQSVEACRADVAERVRGRIPPNTTVKIIVQNCCFETWLLGNRRIYPSVPPLDFRSYSDHYKTATNCPERMGKPSDYPETTATYHYDYFRAMLRCRLPKNLTYSKATKRSEVVQDPAFLAALQQRVVETKHLPTLAELFQVCEHVSQVRYGQG